MSKEQQLIQKILNAYLKQVGKQPIDYEEFESWLKEYAKEQKVKLLWEMIEEWQDARDSDQPEYLSKERFSFVDIENDFYEKLQKIDPLTPAKPA